MVRCSQSANFHHSARPASGLTDATVMHSLVQAITATSQQSRFYKETLETSCEDVDLKDVNLLVGDQELLVDANLRLFSGVHYGLVGANGVGKCDGPPSYPACMPCHPVQCDLPKSMRHGLGQDGS